MTEPLRIGILGAADIAPRALIAPVARRRDVVVHAVAARDLARAEAFAGRHGIGRAYGSYRALLDDPLVDLVYVPLPPSEHAAWSIAALEAGKDVLCEKPFTLDAAQARAVVDAAASTGRRVVEAFHDRYHPLWQRTVEIVATLGRVERVEGEFLGWNPYEPGTIRHEPAFGGGALMDLGCYPLTWARGIVGAEPEVGAVTVSRNPSGADMEVDAELMFPGGVTGRVRASMASRELVDERRVIAEGGTLEVSRPVFAGSGHSLRWRADGVERVETVAGRETFDHQLESVLEALRSGEPLPTEGRFVVDGMIAMDAVRAVGADA